ncbi:Hypothetical protein RG1141_CH20630 [Neorhizobium galegae bv. officinalis bv. officinalis str. HAMBI 1141]|uniref:Uncharacterized protein n=1 Tax=Neorhizobium galegae bv. officinalis bv. officinalis str. HAMBI 1141 TaxID=1028801 RepID=A0A068T7B4_NEOGA|nr:Hypothetical protein RG1141_CH20630 [Neorhizobium galegae bv. officinalis bv. officinalis str. HAMBI 1141]
MTIFRKLILNKYQVFVGNRIFAKDFLEFIHIKTGGATFYLRGSKAFKFRIDFPYYRAIVPSFNLGIN